MKSGVYTIYNKLEDRYYVGSSVRDINFRLKDHISALSRNKHRNSYLQNSFNKYGLEAFEFDVLEYYPKEVCLSMEQYWMNMLNSTNRDRGYNLAIVAGNSYGQKRTIEQRANISNSLKGKRVGKLNPRYGTTWSEETREKISNSSRNKIVLKLDLEGNILEEYKSLSEAGKLNNLYSDHIGKVCNNKPNHLTAGGYKWKFKNG